MKRRANFLLLAGFFLVVAGLVSYAPFFSLFPITRDFPWVNLLLFFGGALLLGVGVMRAFRQPELYRGKILGCILSAISVAGISFFSYGLFYVARQLPSASAAPRVGEKAPGFTLPDQNGKAVTLADLVTSAPAGTAGAKPNWALLIFYRGYW